MNRSTNNTRYSASGIGRNVCRVFSETAAFESYGVKHERKGQKNRLTSSGFALFVYPEGTKSHNEGRVSTPAR